MAFYFGPYLAWALLPRTLGFIYYYLPAATTASFALVYALRRGKAPRWLLWAFVAIGFAGFVVMLPISAGVRRNVDGDVQPADDLSELDLRPKRDPPAVRQADRSFRCHFDAVLVSMLTTWTRRLVGSIGALRILRLGLAVADGDEVGAVDAVFLGQVPLDGVGAALG